MHKVLLIIKVGDHHLRRHPLSGDQRYFKPRDFPSSDPFHTIMATAMASNILLQCDICQSHFSRQEHLRRHSKLRMDYICLH